MSNLVTRDRAIVTSGRSFLEDSAGVDCCCGGQLCFFIASRCDGLPDNSVGVTCEQLLADPDGGSGATIVFRVNQICYEVSSSSQQQPTPPVTIVDLDTVNRFPDCFTCEPNDNPCGVLGAGCGTCPTSFVVQLPTIAYDVLIQWRLSGGGQILSPSFGGDIPVVLTGDPQACGYVYERFECIEPDQEGNECVGFPTCRFAIREIVSIFCEDFGDGGLLRLNWFFWVRFEVDTNPVPFPCSTFQSQGGANFATYFIDAPSGSGCIDGSYRLNANSGPFPGSPPPFCTTIPFPIVPVIISPQTACIITSETVTWPPPQIIDVI